MDVVGVSAGKGRALFADSFMDETKWTIYDDNTRTWQKGAFAAAFTDLGLLALPDGRILFYPTDPWYGSNERIMIIEPVGAGIFKTVTGPVMPEVRKGAASVLDEERVLIVGYPSPKSYTRVFVLHLPTMTLRELPHFEALESAGWAGLVALGDGFALGVHDSSGPKDKLPVFDAQAEVWRSVPFESSVGYPPLPAPDGHVLLLTGYPGTLWAVSVSRTAD
jgi:hypothetical protein